MWEKSTQEYQIALISSRASEVCSVSPPIPSGRTAHSVQVPRFLSLALASLVQLLLSAASTKSFAMSSSPGAAVLTYWKGRGRANPIRFMLEETKTPYTENFLSCKADIEKLRSDGLLMYNQVPLLQIDGINLVQSEACLRHLARKHDMLGGDAAESALIDMVHAATLDLRACCLPLPFAPLEERSSRLETAINTTVPKFLGPIDSLLSRSGTGFVAGGGVSLADVTLFESVCFLLDAPYVGSEWIGGYASVKKHHDMMSERLGGYLASDRCLPFPDDAYAATVRATLN